MGMPQRLDAVIDKAISEKRIVGASVLVSRAGENVYARAAGMADRENNKPAELDSIYRYASLTKPIVAATILAMIEKNLLALEDPISKHLPYFTPRLADGTRPTITIRHLLTHTAGLTRDISFTQAELARPEIQAISGIVWHLSLEDSMRRLANMPLSTPPGSVWSYGQSLDVLGALAAQVNGTDLGAALHKYVTGPLGMGDTGFRVTDPSRLALAYADAETEPVVMGEPHSVTNNRTNDTFIASPARIFDPKAYPSGGGGMAGTATDFIKFLNALQGSAPQAGGTPILQPQTIAMAAKNQIGDIAGNAPEPGWRFGFFGAVLATPETARPTPQTKGTYAWGGIFGSSWFVDPSAKLCVVALTNTAFEGCNGAFPDDIRDAVYGT